jgi:TPR repeat protein
MKKIQKKLSCTILCFFLLLFNQTAIASEFILGATAYKQGDLVQAFEYWERDAKSGSSTAQFNLGVLYGAGLGVKQDFDQSYDWYQLSASNNHPMGQLQMGFLYYYKNKNFTEAAKWLHLAATQNNPRAMYRLSMMYTTGTGVPQNLGRAVEFQSESEKHICSMGIGLESTLMAPILEQQ